MHPDQDTLGNTESNVGASLPRRGLPVLQNARLIFKVSSHRRPTESPQFGDFLDSVVTLQRWGFTLYRVDQPLAACTAFVDGWNGWGRIG